jgi:hypothetical protein
MVTVLSGSSTSMTARIKERQRVQCLERGEDLDCPLDIVEVLSIMSRSFLDFVYEFFVRPGFVNLILLFEESPSLLKQMSV